MCGICGKLTYKGEAVAEDELLRMRDSMTHRGPDDAGLFLDNQIGLGHRRLSIIDLAGGKQPIFNEDNSLVIIFNGEIYNFQTLREALVAKGHIFTTRTDTEVILHSYEDEGVGCLKHFRGMFAFAIWDKRKRQLFLARDRLGVKPLYYSSSGKAFLFASEIKALFQSKDLRPQLNETGLARCLKYRFVYGKQTLFKNVCELLPGHYMIVGNDGIRIKKYWELPFSQQGDSGLRELKTRLIEGLDESVEMRMISDVPIGVFLSGGVDSSAVAGLMSRHAQKIKTFSIGFIPEELNELRFARSVADSFYADHHEYLLESEDFFSLLRKLVWHHDEPLMFPASIPLYILSRLSKNNATVMLAGEGSDELFAGYSSNLKAYWLHRFGRAVPYAIKNCCLRFPLSPRYRSIVKKSISEDEAFIGSFFQHYANHDIPLLCEWIDMKHVNDDDLYEEIGFSEMRGSFLEKLLFFQIKTYLVALLMKQDKMSMAASIETRVPFLDHHFVEMACRIPDKYKIRMRQGKYILKRACEGLLTKDIIYRKKMGFPVPLARWFREKGNSFVALLLDPSTRNGSFLNFRSIEKTIERFNQGDNNALHNLWTFLNIELWRREFLQ